MPFTLIKGSFVPEAGRPDGDSMRFRPDNPDPIFRLRRRGRPPRVNANNGTIQLRFEGIDTMESKAALPHSKDATDSNLSMCGVPDGTGEARGHILTNQLGPNGRPISFVFAGESQDTDGRDDIFLDVDGMKTSINFKQISLGHAYPLFYDTLFHDLRISLAEETAAARQRGQHVWTEDVTETGGTYAGPDSLKVMPPIFPKLWRRLDSYSRSGDVSDPNTLDELKDYLESLREERVFIPSEQRATGFDDLVIVEGDKARLTHKPEDIIVVSV